MFKGGSNVHAGYATQSQSGLNSHDNNDRMIPSVGSTLPAAVS